jgi:hypothetical protein
MCSSFSSTGLSSLIVAGGVAVYTFCRRGKVLGLRNSRYDIAAKSASRTVESHRLLILTRGASTIPAIA